MYIKRHIEQALQKAASMFGAVLVTGARQVGKTTLLREVVRDVIYVSLDDPVLRNQAVQQPATFFLDSPPPICIDEVQYAPGLFPYIKIQIDQTKQKGLFYLSGSQQFHMMKNVSESLAGRVGILNLLGISLRERFGISFDHPFVPDAAYLEGRKNDAAPLAYKDIWQTIFRGSMPELVSNSQADWQMYYATYVRTYIERDVRELSQVADELKFYQFMTAVTAMNGQLLNMASLSRDVGVSQPTIERWLSVLQASSLIYLLQPYHNNILKRAIKSPKLYFMDTGLAAYLGRWPNSEVLSVGASAGAFFESFVISEIYKSYTNAGILQPPLYFYRDRDGAEIDLLIQSGDTLHPVEIKKHADPRSDDISAFGKLDNLSGLKRGSGGIVCMYDRLITLKDTDKIIPVWYL
mgnify:CR=1 FL=1